MALGKGVGAAGLVLSIALAASADTVRLEDGREVVGHVVVRGETVYIHGFAGVTKVGLADVVDVVVEPTFHQPEHAVDPEGLFHEAERADHSGDRATAARLRQLGAEREVFRRAEDLPLEDTSGWRHLSDAAAASGLREEVVADLRSRRVPPSTATVEDVPTGHLVELRMPPPVVEDRAGSTPEGASYCIDVERTWQTPRRWLSSGARVVVVYPGGCDVVRQEAARAAPERLYGIGHGHVTPRPRERFGQSTFNAARAQRTTADAIRSARSVTFGAASGQGHQTFRRATSQAARPTVRIGR